MHEAATAHHYGMSESAAVPSVTSIPAQALRLSSRVGMLREGLVSNQEDSRKRALTLFFNLILRILCNNLGYECTS